MKFIIGSKQCKKRENRSQISIKTSDLSTLLLVTKLITKRTNRSNQLSVVDNAKIENKIFARFQVKLCFHRIFSLDSLNFEARFSIVPLHDKHTLVYSSILSVLIIV